MYEVSGYLSHCHPKAVCMLYVLHDSGLEQPVTVPDGRQHERRMRFPDNFRSLCSPTVTCAFQFMYCAVLDLRVTFVREQGIGLL